MRQRHVRTPLAGVAAAALLVGAALVVATASARPAAPAASIKVGLITKDATNPFFVKMRAGATLAAARDRKSVV